MYIFMIMQSFRDYLTKREWFGGSANDPSNVEDEGDGGDGVAARMVGRGAFPFYSDSEKPPVKRYENPEIKKTKKNKPGKKPGLR